ncbi:MAG: UDP-N-acetylmuramoyl-tripeptide--D-alanyl-D-alanine ligase [Pseudomonadota bacterium]
MSLWTLKTLADAAGGALSGAEPETAVTGISIDTRTLSPGDAFFAIRGVSKDGHQFVQSAMDAGAAAALIDHGEALRAIKVDDTQAALERVGVAARARLMPDTPVVAVTGSVGKTGTKELLRLAFGVGGSVHASAASHNNLWGVPLTLARMPAEVDAGIFEIGMSHAGEITPLTKMVRPSVAIITTVGPVHLEFFDSVAGIADAKAEIFAGLQPGGTAIIPADNTHAARLTSAAEVAGAKILTFGSDRADAYLTRFDPATGRTRALVMGEVIDFTVSGGMHIARNALAVALALLASGRPLAGMAALSDFAPQKGRGRRVRLAVPGGEALLLDEAYNANPSSMAAAFKSLAAAPGRRIAILGDMLELGPTAPDLHRGLAMPLVEAGARIVHTVGTMVTHLANALPADRRGRHADTVEDLLADLPELEPGDSVLVKGSNAVQLGRVVEAFETRYVRGGGDV